MKPKWFYENIGMIAKHDPKLALKAFDAEILDNVTVELTISKERIDVYDPAEYSRVASLPGQTEAIATVRWVSAPGTTPKFNPIKLMLRPETINTYAVDMSKPNGQWRPYILFESSLIDHGVQSYSYSHTGPDSMWLHVGGWEMDGKWYFIQPAQLNMNTKPLRRDMDLW
jgi:hypothetical protein